MEPITIDVTQESPLGLLQIDTSISFKPFIDFLERKADEERTVKRTFFEMVLGKLRANPAFSEKIPLEDIGRYKEELSLIYGMLMPPIADEKDVCWAMSAPVNPVVFYGTSGFYDLLMDSHTGGIRCDLEHDDNVDTKTHKLQMLYSIILERCYDLPEIYKHELIVSLKDEKSGLQKYYKLNIDTRFCEIYPKDVLPKLDLDAVRNEMHDSFDIDRMTEILPLSLFRFEGFSVITLKDVTAEHAVESIKNTILDRASIDSHTYFTQVTSALKMLTGDDQFNFGSMPILRVNNKLVFNRGNVLYSKLMNAATENGMAESMYLGMADEYLKAPKPMLVHELTQEFANKKDFGKLLYNDGVRSYALLPVFYDNKVVGLLEVFSKNPNAVNEPVLHKLDVALPLLAQIFKNYIDEFNAGIDNVIREKFTSLQPAVQWRFRETAWHYMRDKALSPNNAAIEDIHFKNVYPLYGAIDIRNSTIERNIALKQDLNLQFTLLIETFTVLKKSLGFGLADEMIFKCRKWLEEINDAATDNDEMKVRDFLELEAHPFLQHFKEESLLRSFGREKEDEGEVLLRKRIDEYFAVIDEYNGEANSNRKALEASMQMINSSVNLYLDLFRQEIQQSYPTYFEKFRTDGIEYDIYIGQSIEPEKKFSELYLKNIRLWQLTSMAAITRITHSLIPQMQRRLETTQLIFINSSSIDISFRDDERRFDVEGAYNIRYQVIKKRIDKVHIKGTGERLTQPGKIAMVYFNNKSAEEYVGYVRYLQEKNTLLNDLEFLDLEELQGVTGLKALRVGVNLDATWD
ncbi:GAF domain-containing protein [Dyadobacter sp. CY323]|uniref:GAF domain-containing protein n=1 Tax=Dyadobacter sp. CY323 TaxID=2907302 RepID=UPI001F328B87|nr:GAF domain-containing protein [Dyadobacter sp. CY323]MCE6989381.1 GAF domain-containing protein [Dyadobacter sp. CY323]